MLRETMTALATNDRKLVAEVSRTDNIVDRLHEAIKLYVTKITRGSLDDRDGRRATEIISFAIDLEHIGDIIDKNLLELANKRLSTSMSFPRRVLPSLKRSTSGSSTT
jgi:phosphate:Na+ symporter